jgi:cytochrome c biogenesis protein CcmG/thiol:disulfide interchange protein DsbE
LPSTPSSAPSDAPPPRRARWFLAAVAVVVVGIVGAITWAAVAGTGDGASKATVVPAAVRDGGPRVGDLAPEFTLTTLDGKQVGLADYRGKPVVLNFWASWCNPCRKEFPRFREALAARPGTFAMLGVDYQDITSDARAFARSQHATWPMLDDSGHAVSQAYGIRAVPQTFFIDRTGKIAQRFYAEPTAEQFASALAMITGRPSR